MIRSAVSHIDYTKTLSMMNKRQKRLVCIAALSSFASGAHAWAPGATTSAISSFPSTSRTQILVNEVSPMAFHQDWRREYGSTRLCASSKGQGQGGIVSKIKNVARKFLPTKIFGTTEEKEKLARRKELKSQVSGNLNEALRGAPMGIQMMGRVFGPLVSSVASRLAETVAEQQKATEGLLDDASRYLVNDPSVTNLLGEPISLGAPFSQASSTSSINGKSQTRIDLALPVSGSRSSGTVRIVATQDGISQMQLDAGGQRLSVSLQAPRFSKGPTSGFPSRTNGDDNIIEAEIIDKETK